MTTQPGVPEQDAPQAPTIWCSRCGTSIAKPDPRVYGWVVRDEPVVVQGLTLGLCPACYGAPMVARCDGKCGGAYEGTPERPAYEAILEDDDTWSCWDPVCVGRIVARFGVEDDEPEGGES